MTKVERVVEAVKAAATVAAIEAALMECKKAELYEVFLSVCGANAKKASDSWKKAELAHVYAIAIKEHSDEAGDSSHADDGGQLGHGEPETSAIRPDQELGSLTFKYERRGKHKEELTVREYRVPESGDKAFRRYQGARALRVYAGEECIAQYSPYADILEFTSNFQRYENSRNYKNERLLEAEFRKQLPEYLQAGGYLDRAGELIPDGNEEYRIKLYKWCMADSKRMPSEYEESGDTLLSREVRSDDPLTWTESRERRRGLVVKFRLMYEETELRLHRGRTEPEVYSQRVEDLRKELQELYASYASRRGV